MLSIIKICLVIFYGFNVRFFVYLALATYTAMGCNDKMVLFHSLDVNIKL